MLKRFLTIFLILIIALTSGLSGWWYSQRLQITSTNVISISMEAKAQETLHQDEKTKDIFRYYYLSTLIGDGTIENKYRPAVADYATNYGMYDLRADCTKVDGYCIAHTDGIYPITGDPRITVLAWGLTLNDTLTQNKISALNSALKTKAAGASFPELVYDLLTTQTKVLGINPLAPETDGKTRLFLGGQVYGEEPPAKTHTTIYESFNQGDSTTLGPELSWTEPEGTAWCTHTNKGECGGNISETAYPSDTMSSADHYAQATLDVLYRYGGVCTFYLAIRSNTNAIGTATFYMGTCSKTGTSTYNHGLEKIVAGSWSNIQANATAYSTSEVLYFEADGSTLTLKKNGASVNSHSDSSIASGSYVRIGYYGTSSSNGINIDEFYASELVLPPEASNTPSSHDFGVIETSSYSASGMVLNLVNTGSVAIDAAISGTDAGGGDDTWALSDTATPGSNTYGLKAGTDVSYSTIVKKTPPYNTLVSNLPVSSNQTWGMVVYTPTSVPGYDAQVMTAEVTLVITAH